VAAVNDNDVWAVGYVFGDGYDTLAEHWDGFNWSVVPSFNTPNKDNYLLSVTAISSRNVRAVGYDLRATLKTSLVGTLEWQSVDSCSEP